MDNTQIPKNANNIRYHIVWDACRHWVCYDRETAAIGAGRTPQNAMSDCQVDLELTTSDIHQ